MDKKKERLRRAKKTRERIRQCGRERLCVHKTSRHLYAQIISSCNSKVLVSVSTLEKELRKKIKYGGNIAAAHIIAQALAERAKAAGILKVAFDRSGFKYHGRIKAFADTAREQGMEF